MNTSAVQVTAPVTWTERYEEVEGVVSAGPAEAQRVRVLKVGDVDAARVLVLLGGREGGANIFRHAARQLAETVPGLQIWAVDRREQYLADLSGFTAGPDRARDYYLGGRYIAQNGDTAGYAADWGLEVLVNDIRRVVRDASDGGRRSVVLGGVSVGATAALHYAAWDFDGVPGFTDLAGLVVADGGVYEAYRGIGLEFDLPLEAAQGWLAQIRGGAVFENATSIAVGLGELPESASIWLQLAAQYALHDPHGTAVLADQLPENRRPERRLTNRGLFGWLLDAATRHPSYSVHAGRLSDTGDWVDGGPTPLDTVAEAYAGPEPGSWVWYTLNRTMLDYVAANGFVENEVTRFLGLRISHGAAIDVPLYAFQSGLTGGTVGQAAANLVQSSRITEASLHSDL
ncbi:MAG: alpha/beta fold hydrolase, partial [Actinomycetes bacterium]